MYYNIKCIFACTTSLNNNIIKYVCTKYYFIFKTFADRVSYYMYVMVLTTITEIFARVTIRKYTTNKIFLNNKTGL